MKKRKSTSIKQRLFRAISLPSLLLSILILLASFSIFFKSFIDKEASSSIHQLEYISNQLDTYLTTVDNYSRTIMRDSRIQGYALKYNSNFTDFDAIDQREIKSVIYHIIQSASFIHSVSLYSTDQTLIATTEIYPSSHIEELETPSDILWIPKVKNSNTKKDEKVLTLTMIRPFYNFTTGSLLGYLEIAVPEEIISNIYKNMSDDLSHLFIVDKEGIIQSTDGSKALLNKYDAFHKVVRPFKDSYKLVYPSIIFIRYFAPADHYIVNEVNLFGFLKVSLNVLRMSLFILLIFSGVWLYIAHRISKTITSPIYDLVSHTQKIKEGNWEPANINYSDNEIGLLFKEFNSMILAQNQLKDQLLENEKTKSKITLNLMQEQIKPHFLYNTLDNICSLAELDEKETLINLVMNLSAFYRKGLSSGKFKITVKEELDLTRAYLDIMKIRYIDLFDYEISCGKDLFSCPCLKLLLQPLVENSIYHGIKELDKKGFLQIKVRKEGKSILLTVRDNGIGLSEEILQQIWELDNGHYGLKNIHNRVQLYYGQDYGLTISNHPKGGCVAVIRIGNEGVENEI